MVSIIVGLVIAFSIGIGYGIKNKDALMGFWVIVFSLWIALLGILLVGLFNNEIVDYTDYDVYSVGQSLYYIKDDGKMVNLDSSYPVCFSKDVKTVKYRLNKYDQTYLVRGDTAQIIIPESVTNRF